VIRIKKVVKKNTSFVVLTEDNNTVIVPDDFDNTDRVQIQEWIDAGNQVEQDSSSVSPTESLYNWQGLAIAFKISQLNGILNTVKDEGTNPQVNAVWRISDELVQVLTLPIFAEGDRVAGMTRDLLDLFEKLKEGKIDVPAVAKQEIVQALVDNGFEQVAKTLSQYTGTR
jgi:hypothetical protein